MGNTKITFETEIKINEQEIQKKINKIDGQIDRLKENAKNIQLSNKGNTDIGKGLTKSLENAVKELTEIKTSYSKIMDSVSNKKVDTKEFNNFLKNINDRFETVEGRVNELEESLTKLMKRFDKQLPTSMMQKQVDELKESFNSFTESAQNAIKILSDFSDMVSASANKPKKIGLEIDKTKIEEVEKLIAKLNSDNILNGESSLKINTATATKQLSELYDKYTDLSSKMQESKKPEEIQNLQIELAKLLPQMSDLVNRIITIKKLNASELSEGLAGKISVGSIEDFSALFHFIESEIGTASNNLSRLRDTAKASASNVAEDITTEVSSFTFKNGGVRIPVTVDASSATALQTKYNEIVSALQEYADNHPVNVTMRLFPLNVNRSSAEEITNEMRRIQTDINSIEDEGLKTKLNSLYDDLESQFKKALNLKIKVDLGETEQSAKLRIKELQDAIKAQGLTITPTFDLSKADKEAIVSKLKEIQKSSKLNIGSELKTATKTLESLVTGDQAQKWSGNFATSLGKVYDKLKKLDPYIQSINKFVENAKLNKTNIISDADVKNITALAEGIKSLSSAIDKIVKLDLTKFDTSGITEKIQESVNGEKPVLIPIDPDLSNITSFINKVEDAINSVGLNLEVSDIGLSKGDSKNITQYLQSNENANKLYIDLYKELNKVAGNIGVPIKKKISESLVAGLREGMSSTEQMLRSGFAGTKFEPIVDQIIGDEESLNTIRNVANGVVMPLIDSLKNLPSNSFISNISTQINESGETVDVPISVTPESVNKFVDDIQNLVNEKSININLDSDINSNKSASSQINKIIQAENEMGNEAQSSTNQVKQGLTEMQKEAQKTENAISQVFEVYRGVHQGDFYKSEYGSAWFSDSLQNASTFGADNTYRATVKVNNPMTVDARGAEHGYILWAETEEELEKALQLQEELNKKQQEFREKYKTYFESNDLTDTSTISDINQYREESKEISKLENELEQYYVTTEKLQEIAKSKGYDSLIVKNVRDSFSNFGASKDPATSIAIFNEELIQSKELISDVGGEINKLENLDEMPFSSKESTTDIVTQTDVLKQEEQQAEATAEAEEKLNKTLTDRQVASLKGQVTRVANEIAGNDKLDTSQYTELARKAMNYVEILKEAGVETSDIEEKFNSITQAKYQELFPNLSQSTAELDNLSSSAETATEAENELVGAMDKVDQERADDVTEQSASLTAEEAQAMADLYDKAIKAAEAKEKFAGANKEVLTSIIDSLKSLNSEGDGFKNLNNIINKLSNNKKMTNVVDSLKEIKKALGSKINDNSFLNSIKQLTSNSETLKDLATVLKASRAELERAQNTLNGKSTEQIKEQADNAKLLVNYYKELKSLYSKLGKTSEGSDEYNLIQGRINEINTEKAALEGLTYTETQRQVIKKAQAEADIENASTARKLKEQEDGLLETERKSIEILEARRLSLLNQASSLKSNGKLMGEYGDEVNNMISELSNTSITEERLKEISNRIKEISANAKQAGKSGKSFLQQLTTRFQSLATYLGSFASFYRITSYIRTAITTIVDLDTQLVDLRKTTSMNTAELNNFYNASSDVAKQLGVTTSEIISQASAWSRLGYSSQEAATQMAELSSKFTSISPGMTTDNATDYLVSTMQAYGIAVDDVERKIMDNVNRIGNTFATTNAEIGEMLTRSSAAMRAANNTLEETIALESAAVQITRNAETTGTAFRTISLRIRGYDEETEELSDDLKTISGDIYDLTKINGKGINIFTDETRTEYKSTYQILKDISEIWDDLTDKQQADLLEKLGGKRGAQAIAGILQDFDEVDRALYEMENAAGSADREMEIIMDSLEYKINALKQTWVGILQESLNKESLKSIVNILVSASEKIGDITSNIGVLKTALVGLFTAIGSQKLGLFNYNKNTGFSIGGTGISELFKNQNAEILKQDSSQSFLQFLNTKTPNNSNVFNDYSSDQIRQYASSIEGLDQSLVETAIHTKELGGQVNQVGEEFKKATSIGALFKKGLSSLGSIGAKVLTSIVNGLVSYGISMAISSIIQGIENLANSYDKLAEKANEIGNEFKSDKAKIDDYSSRLIELRTIMKSSTSTTEEITTATSDLYDIQSDLISTYGAYHEGIDLVNGDLEEQLSLLQDINKENAQQAINEINSERSALSSASNLGINLLEHLSVLGGNDLAATMFHAKYKTELQSGSSIKEAIKNVLTGSDMFNIDYGEDNLGTSVDQITAAFENFNAVLAATDNDEVNKLIDSFKEFTAVKNENGDIIRFDVSGSVDEVSDSIVKLQSELLSLGYQNDTLDRQLTKIANNANKIVNNSSEAYNTIIYRAIQYDEELLNYYTLLTEKYNELQQAQDEGDTEKVEQLKEEYVELIGTIMGDGKIDSKYIEYFKSLYPELESIISTWEFQFKIAPELEFESGFYSDESIKDYIKKNSLDELLSQYQKLINGGTTGSTRLDSLFGGISKTASEYGLTVKELLTQMKTLDEYSDKYLSLRNLMGDNWSDEYLELFSDEEINLAVKLDQQSYGNVEERLTELEEGGTVNLNLRPEIDTAKLKAAGWDIDEDDDYATVYTSTYQNEDGTRWLNFTPIIVDPETGQYKGVLSPTSLDEYAEGVINGTREDTYNLQIGAEFDTEEAAEEAAEEIHNLHELKAEGEIEFDWRNYDYDSLKEKLSDMISPVTVTLDIDYSTDATSALDDMETAFDSLDTVYDTVVTNGTKAAASDIQSVIDDFGGVTFDFADDEIDSANSLSNALEKYNDVLVDNNTTTEEAQDATNKLVTAYIDQTDVLDNLDETNYEYYIQMLKNKGITNATEVVLTRLGDTYETTKSKLTSLSLAIAQNRKNLELGEEGGEAYTTAISNISDEVKNFVDVTGTLSETMDDEDWYQFSTDNLDTIMAAVEGDISAIEDLRIAAADKVLESYDVALDTTALDETASKIQEYASDINNTEYTLKIGAEIDSSFSNLRNALVAVKEQFGDNEEAYKKYVETLTGGSITVEYETVDIPVVDLSTINYSGNDGSTQPTMKTIQRMKFVYNGSSEGASVGDNGGDYSGTDDDDDSDSDSDSSDYASETFDWIETAIDRLESQIDRLNSEVDNVYDNWSKRNGALAEEIDAITKEIEIQSDAADRYWEEAESVNIMDEYKTKVQNGDMDVETIDESSITDAIRDYYNDLLAQGIGDTEDVENYEAGELTDSDYVNMLKDSIDDYTDLYEKAMDASDEVVSLTNEKTGLFKDYFDNIKDEYEDFIDVIGKKVDWIEERITRTEEHGYFVDQSYYEDLLANEKDNYATLMAERDELIEAMNTAVSTGGIEKGSSAWNEMYESIYDVNQAIEESITNTVKLNNEIRQLNWDKFDYLEERLNDITDEAEFFIKLLSGEEMYDDQGLFNNRGWANAAMVAAKYNDTLLEAQRYKEEIDEVTEELNKDPYNKDLIERQEELTQAYRDAIEAAEDEKQAMKSLVEEGINKNIEALNNLISEYEEALSAAKDLYDWQKNVSDQTENIANLNKQLQAYQGDDSEESRKRRQELQNQLDEAEQSLEESQWDRYITETNDMLTQLSEDYEETLNARLDNIDLLMQDMIDEINGAKTEVASGLNEVADMYDYTSTNFQDFMSGDYSDDLVSKFEDGQLSTAVDSLTAIEDSVSSIYNKIVEAQDTYYNGVIDAIKEGNDFTLQVNDDGTITKVSGSSGTSGSGNSEPTSSSSGSNADGGGSWKQDDKGWWYQYSDGSYAQNGFKNIDGKEYYFDENGYMLSDQFVQGKWLDRNGESSGEYQWKQSGSDWTYENNDGNVVKNGWANIDGEWYYFDENGHMVTGKVTIGGKSYSFGENGKWLGYKTGSKNIPYNQVAFTQEEGQELIFRSSSGAILTPLGKGDKVFTAEMTDRLWDFASGAMKFDNKTERPEIVSNNMNNVTANNAVSIVLPNVTTYDEFKSALKNDSEMEKFWQEVTVGRMMGNNSLKKLSV